MSPGRADHRALDAAAAVAGSGRVAAGAANAAAAVAGLALALGHPAGPAAVALGVSLLLWLAQTWVALRVELDARLLAALDPDPEALASLDGLLAGWGLRRRPPTPRSADTRCRGSLRLWRRQLALAAAQAAALGAGLALAWGLA